MWWDVDCTRKMPCLVLRFGPDINDEHIVLVEPPPQFRGTYRFQLPGGLVVQPYQTIDLSNLFFPHPLEHAKQFKNSGTREPVIDVLPLALPLNNPRGMQYSIDY